MNSERTEAARTISRFGKLTTLVVILLCAAEAVSFTGIAKSPLRELPHILSGNYFFGAVMAGVFVMHLVLVVSRLEILLVTAAATVFFAVFYLIDASSGGGVLLVQQAAVGAGFASIAALAIRTAASKGEGRENTLSVLLPAIFLPLLMLLFQFCLDLTASIFPATLDPVVYAADMAFGTQLSFVLGDLLADNPLFLRATFAGYFALPAALAFIYGIERKSIAPPRLDIITSFIGIVIAGYAVYLFFPVAGPKFAFYGAYPDFMPPLADIISHEKIIVTPVPRNCMPSLHTALALIIFWHSRSFAPRVRVLTGAFLAATVFSTVALGFHYVVDVIAAVPFTVAMEAISAAAVGNSSREVRRAAVSGSLLAAAWLILLRYGTSLIVDYREIFWVFSAATIPVSLYIKKILDREIYAEALPELSAKDSPPTRKSGIPSAIIRRKDSPPTGEKPQALPVIVVPVVIMFFISGISGLVYEVIFAKSLSLVFGSTAVATTSVLVTYMGGMAAGYWLGGGAASKTRNPLRLYALCEAGIAVWCALSPVMLDGIRTVYVALALNSAPDNQALTALQVALGSLVFAPPAILMGYTLPVLARFVLDSGGRLGGAVGILYGVNTIGAASGALFSGYFLIPWFGIMSATFITAGLNLAVGLSAYLMSGSRSGILSATSSAKDSSAKDSPPTVTSSAKDSSAKDSPPTIIIFIILFIGGIVTFALETTYIHLLAVVAGNSAYAFSLMLFAFLAGLGIGAAAAKKFLLGGANPFGRIAYVEFSLAAVLLAGVFLWNDLPDYFASFELYPLARSFASREFIRFLVCCLAMMPPAICIGAIYPVAMEVIENAAGGRRLAKMGQAVSLNTAGNIIGAFLGGFIMLKHLGSLKTLHLIALTAVLLGFISIICANGGTRKRFAAAAGAVCLALFAFQPAGFDLDRLATGSNVYFASNNFGTVIDHAESVDGGLTTINKVENEGAEILTMLTNGKFQGDNGLNKEMTAQISFALYPAIHTPLRERALVIGLGTGVSVRVLHDAGFKNIEAAELSGDILKMARKYFGSVNRGVLDKPEVSVYVTDGRNFLLLNEKTYDVISMEVSSIWFAGAASLYNREFYRLAKARLNRNGAFQQWIQLHRISTIDVLSIIATMRSEFPYVWLYFAGKQGILIGCVEKCLPDEKTVGSLYSREEMKEVLSIAAPAPADLFEAILLTPEGVDSLLSKAYSIGVDPDHIISTDDNLFLEFSTPKGNVRSYNASLQENVAFLKQFSPVSRGKDSAPTE